MNIKNIINEFLKKFGYFDNKEIEGIIFYGSYQTNTNTQNSDVDLIIVYRDGSKKEAIKGYKRFKKKNFEYFERTLQSLYDRVDYDYDNFEDTLLSVVGYGEILIDNNSNLEKLKKYVINKYKYGLPKLSEKDKIYNIKGLQKSMDYLKKMNINNNPYFKIYYSLVLDKIRIFYNKLGGFSNMSSSKIYKLYTDEKMKIVQHKFMPEEQFIKLYVECIQNIKYENIQNLYTYSIRDISKEIDFDNIRLSLGNRQH